MSRTWTITLLCWAVVLTIAWSAYAPGLGGAFLLDDAPNLSGLATIAERGAIEFIFSGSAGPLGRPIALATFVPQATAWGTAAEPFLRVNVLIHLLNGCLVAWVLYRLSVARGSAPDESRFTGFAAAAAWLLMPMLASSSLMIVQRMTTLSATFVLLGLGTYLVFRHSVEENPRRALAGMSSALIMATLLAVFTKENGALLPVFVLVIEATLLARPQKLERLWRIWTSVFLLLPTLAILAYLVSRLPWPESVALRREFDGWERLLTEAQILWEYLFNAFLPNPGKFGPFHDAHAVARSLAEPITALAVCGWIAAAGAALLWRRRYSLFAFAVLWYLGGHLLESTTIALDLYYEHRNYLPLIGPVYAIGALLAGVPASRRKLVYAGGGGYLAICAVVLFSFTSLWGNPALAFHVWQERSPSSRYAATADMAHIQATKGPVATIEAIRGYVTDHPSAGYLAIHELKLACDINPGTDHRPAIVELESQLQNVEFSYSALTMLSQLAETVATSGCKGIDFGSLRTLAKALLTNESYNQSSTYNQLHHQFIALTYRYEGNHTKALAHLRRAIAQRPSRGLNKLMIFELTTAGDYHQAREYLSEARDNAPWNLMHRYLWMRQLDDLHGYVDRLASSATAPAAAGGAE